MITTKEYEIINEKLEVLIEELDETENRYFINAKEDCNQKISIEQLSHTSNGVQHNTVYNGYYIGHNNSQEYYDNASCQLIANLTTKLNFIKPLKVTYSIKRLKISYVLKYS